MLGKGSKQNISKSFIHSSWKDMSAILDKEMSVPVTKSNPTVMVLSMLLFFSMIAVAFLWFKLEQQIPFTSAVKEKIVFKHFYIEKDQSPDLVQVISSTFNSPTNIRENAEINPNSYLPANQVTGLSETFKATLNTNNLTPENGIINQEVILSHFEAISAKKIFLTGYPGNSSVSKLDNERASAPISLIDPGKTKQSRFGVSLGLLSFISHDMDYTGYGIASGVEYQLSKKLSFASGLGLNFISRDFNFFPFFEKDVSNELYKSLSEYDLKNQETYYSGLRGFKQLLVPLSINYYVNNKFAFSGGIKFRYTYSEKIDKELVKSASKKISVSEDTGNVFFNNSNIGLTVGIKYNLSKNVSMRLDSEWGLSSLINRNNFNFPSNRKRYDLNLVNLSTSFTF